MGKEEGSSTVFQMVFRKAHLQMESTEQTGYEDYEEDFHIIKDGSKKRGRTSVRHSVPSVVYPVITALRRASAVLVRKPSLCGTRIS